MATLANESQEPVKSCPHCGHPLGESCGGDYIHTDQANEYVADNYDGPDYCP